MFSSGKYDEHSIIFIHFFRDAADNQAFYEPISVIEFQGRVTPTGESSGHYICDVKEKLSNLWFRTNDDCHPVEICPSDVSRNGYVFLYKRI